MALDGLLFDVDGLVDQFASAPAAPVRENQDVPFSSSRLGSKDHPRGRGRYMPPPLFRLFSFFAALFSRFGWNSRERIPRPCFQQARSLFLRRLMTSSEPGEGTGWTPACPDLAFGRN
jgi:hypothetical protein